MSREVIELGRFDDEPPRPRRRTSSQRPDRTTAVMAVAVLVALSAGVTAARATRPAERERDVAAPVAAGPAAAISPTGGVVVGPVVAPDRRGARRAAELVAAAQCRNIERPRYRRIDPLADTDDGRSATFVVGRASDTPRKSAGFVLRLRWREGAYVGQVSDAYGGCASG